MMTNLLPCDGVVNYFPGFLDAAEADRLQEALMNEIDWASDRIKVFGKLFITDRQVAWYADEGLNYTYSGAQKTPKAWTNSLLEIKQKAEMFTGKKFNACLLNLYHTGEEGMGWHSDNEPELGKEPVIVSISLGAKRKFAFKHKHKDLKYTIELEHGSLLLMSGLTQHLWKHALLKSKRITVHRINLTFRNIITQKYINTFR